MAAPISSNPWHPIFLFLIATTAVIVQMHFHGSSPLVEHAASIWTCIIGLLSYFCSVGYHDTCLSLTPARTASLNCCVKGAFVSGSLTYTALISLLLPRSLQPLVFILCFMLLLIYFNREKIAEMAKHMAAYLCDLWRRTKSRASSLYDRWRRTESDDVPASRQSQI